MQIAAGVSCEKGVTFSQPGSGGRGVSREVCGNGQPGAALRLCRGITLRLRRRIKTLTVLIEAPPRADRRKSVPRKGSGFP